MTEDSFEVLTGMSKSKDPTLGFDGLFIPRQVLFDKSLSDLHQKIWSLIRVFSRHDRQCCWATNETIGKFFDVSVTHVSRVINDLIQRGLVEVLFFDGRRRVLKVVESMAQANLAENVEDTPTETSTYIGNTLDKEKRQVTPYTSPVGVLVRESGNEWISAKEQDGGETLAFPATTDVPAAKMSAAELTKLADSMGYNIQKRKKVDPAVVEHIYSIYPKKKDRGKALKAIAAALQKAEAEVLIEAVTAYAAARRTEGEDPKFTKSAEGWFNAEKWLDDRSAWIFGDRNAATTRKFRAKNGKMLDSPDDVESYEWHNSGLRDDMWTLPERLRHKYPELR